MTNPDAPSTAQPTTTPPPAPRRRGPLVALIGAIAVVVAAASTGIGIAIGSGADDDERTASVVPTDSPSSSAATGGPSTGTRSSGTGSSGQAADFARARDAALAAVPGTVTEIKRVGEGWTVDVRRDSDSADLDVVLGGDFSVARVGDPDGAADGGDLRPLGSLAGDSLTRAVDAALAHAGSGTVTSIELADTAPEAYEVKVSQNAVETTITLGQDSNVLRTEQDD